MLFMSEVPLYKEEIVKQSGEYCARLTELSRDRRLATELEKEHRFYTFK